MLIKPKPLRCVFAEPGAQGRNPKVSVSFAPPDSAGVLAVSFAVSGATPHVNATLSKESSQWGLWDWDVVELFLSANDTPVYYELQLSPLGQYFELEIFEPRKRFNKQFASGFGHSVNRLGADAWQAEFKIPLSKLGWNGKVDTLRGNAFAILGEPGAKSYLSLNLPEQEKPDFHLPQYFDRLI